MKPTTPQMIDALQKLSRQTTFHYKPFGVNFSTMTALVKRGLVERDSLKVIERRYSSQHGFDQLQCRDRKGWWYHEYWLTPEGLEELERHV